MLFHRLFVADSSLLSYFRFSSTFDVNALCIDFSTPNKELFENVGFLEYARIVVWAIDMLVKDLGDLGKCAEILTDLGARHKEYGVTLLNYDTLGLALVGTLRAELRGKFGEREEESWMWLSGVIKAIMTKTE
jgi:hypothetical protein